MGNQGKALQSKGKSLNHSLVEIEIANACVNAPDPDTRQEARASFLRAIKEIRSDVLDCLFQDVWPIHRELFQPKRGLPINQAIFKRSQDTEPFDPQSLSHYNSFFWSWKMLVNLDWKAITPRPFLKKIVSLRDAAAWWAERYRLTDDWCLDYALITLYKWSYSAEPDLDWDYKPRQFFIPIDTERHFNFTFSAWHVDAEDWASYEKRLKEALRRTILAYRNHQKEKAGSTRITPARKKREMMHYRWLVDFHIPQDKGWTLSDSEIAGKYGGRSGLERSTVYEAIYSTASLIGLTSYKTNV